MSTSSTPATNGHATNTSLDPRDDLRQRSTDMGYELTSIEFAKKMDAADPLASFKDKFHYPKCKDSPKIDMSLVEPEEDTVYFCNNSLGLLPKVTRSYIEKELKKWEQMGVYGHLHGDLPWAYCDEKIVDQMAVLVGAESSQVMLMNALTTNIHFLLISFYRPTPQRHKIVIEGKAFPSDHYAVESQIRLKGFTVEDSMVLLTPREGEECLRPEDILSYIEKEGESIACVFLSGVQYYTGQVFDMQAITKAAQQQGCTVGWDLAHAVGNVEIKLDEWGVDFACWCTYKYLCSGAGGIGGAYINKRHNNNNFPKLHGWWSHDMSTRFLMDNEMQLAPGIAGYRISNPSMLQTASLAGSLQVYSETSMAEFRAKSLLLTGYLELMIRHHFGEDSSNRNPELPTVTIITPTLPEHRGCQLSLKFSIPIAKLAVQLHKRGVVFDKREPDVLRMAPNPFVNRYEDVYRFIDKLHQAMAAVLTEKN